MLISPIVPPYKPQRRTRLLEVVALPEACSTHNLSCSISVCVNISDAPCIPDSAQSARLPAPESWLEHQQLQRLACTSNTGQRPLLGVLHTASTNNQRDVVP